MHTSLAVRYLRECVKGSEIMELTINHQLLDALGEIYEKHPRVLGIVCYIWNIEMVKKLLELLPKALPETVIICGGPEVSYGTADFMREFPMVDFVIRGEGEEAVPKLIARICQFHFEKQAMKKVSSLGVIPGVAMRCEDGTIEESTDVTVADFANPAVVPFGYREEEMEGLRERILIMRRRAAARFRVPTACRVRRPVYAICRWRACFASSTSSCATMCVRSSLSTARLTRKSHIFCPSCSTSSNCRRQCTRISILKSPSTISTKRSSRP